MKRTRGHKKGKKSKKFKSSTEQENLNESVENSEYQTSEQSSGGPAECENSEHESKTEVDAPSSTASGSSPIASVDPVASDTTAKSVGRVKVKLKTSKATEPDVPLRNDIDKATNSPHTDSEISSVADEKKEEPVPRLPERKPVLNVYRKMKNIKIKSSKAVDGSSSVTEKSGGDAVKAQDAKVFDKYTETPDENSQVKKLEPGNEPVSQVKNSQVDVLFFSLKRDDWHEFQLFVGFCVE